MSLGACVCDPPWTGPLCDQDPCAALENSCGGRGRCVGVDDSSYVCECLSGYSGRDCEHDCASTCAGEAPAFGCNPGAIAQFQLCNAGGGCAYTDTTPRQRRASRRISSYIAVDACAANVLREAERLLPGGRVRARRRHLRAADDAAGRHAVQLGGARRRTAGVCVGVLGDAGGGAPGADADAPTNTTADAAAQLAAGIGGGVGGAVAAAALVAVAVSPCRRRPAAARAAAAGPWLDGGGSRVDQNRWERTGEGSRRARVDLGAATAEGGVDAAGVVKALHGDGRSVLLQRSGRTDVVDRADTAAAAAVAPAAAAAAECAAVHDEQVVSEYVSDVR